MKKRLLFLASLLAFVTNSANAQLLWKVSGNGTDKVSYIFGTHHVAPLSICDSIVGFDDAFNSCELFYGEVVMDDMMAAANQMMSYVMMPKDTTWAMLYSDQEYKVVDDFLKDKMKFGIESFKTVKPSLVSSQLALKLSNEVFTDFSSENQLDSFLQKRAKDRGVEVKGFESVIYQASLLFGAPLSEQASDLMDLAKDFELARRGSIEMCDLYMKRDLEGLFRSMEKPEYGMTPQKMDRMVYDRNRNWVEQLRDILPNHSTFIVVGAGHLLGEFGLVDLLRGQGYSVVPVN